MFKKALAMLLCIVMVLSLATVTFAAETRITIQAESATDVVLSSEKYHLYDENYLDHTNRVLTGKFELFENNPNLINIRYNDKYTYSVEVATAGTYTFGVNGTCDRDTPFTLYVDGAETAIGTGAFMDDVDGYGSPTLADSDLLDLHLTAGTHTIKVIVEHKANHNFGADYFYLDLVEADPEPEEAKEILKGTATVDGVLDEAYKNSLKLTVDQSSVIWVPKADPDTVSAEVYFLHDGEYLYICGVITGDSKIVNTNPQSTAEWAVDGLDIWFLLPDQPMRTKFTMDAFALPYGEGGLGWAQYEGMHDLDPNKITKAAVRGDGSYVVEAKIPVPYYMESEQSLAINVQLNNVYDENVNTNVGNFNCGFYGKQYSNAGQPLDANMAVLSDDSAMPPVGDSDPTGDAISLVFAMLAVSGLGIAVISGKKKF